MPAILHTLTGHELPATDHAIENVASLGTANGILYGMSVTAVDNTIIIGNGYGMICGRLFEVQTETLEVVLPASTRQGQVIVTLDLSLEDPLTITYDLTGASLIQTADAVFTDGIYQLQLCTFTASSSEVSDPIITCQTLKGIGLVTSGDYIKQNKTVAQNLKYLDTAIKGHHLHPGRTDVLTPVCFGHITNSKKTIEVMVPLKKTLGSDVSGISVYSLYATVRQTGPGYLYGAANSPKAIDPAHCTVYDTRGGLRLVWTESKAINDKAINNGLVSMDVQLRLTLT